MSLAVDDWGHAGEIEDTELVLKAAGREKLAVVWWESDCADDVVVLNGV